MRFHYAHQDKLVVRVMRNMVRKMRTMLVLNKGQNAVLISHHLVVGCHDLTFLLVVDPYYCFCIWRTVRFQASIGSSGSDLTTTSCGYRTGLQIYRLLASSPFTPIATSEKSFEDLRPHPPPVETSGRRQSYEYLTVPNIPSTLGKCGKTPMPQAATPKFTCYTHHSFSVKKVQGPWLGNRYNPSSCCFHVSLF